MNSSYPAEKKYNLDKEYDLSNYSTDEESTVSCNENFNNIDTENITHFEEYKLRNRICDLLLSSKALFIMIGFIFMIMAFFTWYVPYYNIVINDVRLSMIFLTVGISILSHMVLGIFINFLTHYILKKKKGDSSYCFYINELSFHISFIVIITILYMYTHYTLKEKDFLVFTFLKKEITVSSLIRASIVPILILCALKLAERYVSMRFNYNTYMEGIRKCILVDFFITTVSEIEDISEDLIEESKSEHVIKMNDEDGMPFIIQKRFRIADPTQLAFREKRLLIKEFQELKPKLYSGDFSLILGKIKHKANNKANKILKRFKIHNKTINDLEKPFIRKFSDRSVFKYISNQLKLNLNDHDNRASNTIDEIRNIIEKAYINRYFIKKSLEEINSAIKMVYNISKALVFLFLIIFIITEVDSLVGLLSAILGTQFISKILSDNVIQPIIFLFVIHPFDIGDRVLIKLDGIEENLVVEKLNVFSTTFYRIDGTKVIVPNSVLVGVSITNIRRSQKIMETHLIQIGVNTKEEKIEQFKMMLVEFVKNNPEKYTDYILVNYERIEEGNKLYLKILMQYKRNQQNYEEYLENRSRFVLEMNRIMIELKIKYEMPKQRIKLIDKRSKVRYE